MKEKLGEKTFVADVAEVPKIVEFVAELAGKTSIHPKRLMHLELAVEEASMNICTHAYKIKPGDMQVIVNQDEEKFSVEIFDEGTHFDPLSLDEPDVKASLEERNIGGLGVLLMRRVMDEVYYCRQGKKNILMMSIYFDVESLA